jgi:hypothetical protein
VAHYRSGSRNGSDGDRRFGRDNGCRRGGRDRVRHWRSRCRNPRCCRDSWRHGRNWSRRFRCERSRCRCWRFRNGSRGRHCWSRSCGYRGYWCGRRGCKGLGRLGRLDGWWFDGRRRCGNIAPAVVDFLVRFLLSHQPTVWAWAHSRPSAPFARKIVRIRAAMAPALVRFVENSLACAA